MTQPRVAIVTVNWNGLADTTACLESLRKDHYRQKNVIVVDNGSTDDSVVRIRQAFPEVTVLSAGRNLGFTGANNLGLRHAIACGADYLYCLNNDTISDAGTVEALVSAGESQPQYGLLTPVIHYFDEPQDVWFAGSRIDLGRGIAVHDNSKIPERSDDVQAIPWASGCAMFGRCERLARLGGFDDRFFLNWEDVDLSLRVRKAGYLIGLVPAGRVYHKVGRSFSRCSHVGLYYHVRNHLLLLSCHQEDGYAMATARVICTHARDSLRATLRDGGRPGSSLSVTLRAIADHLRGRYGNVAVPRPWRRCRAPGTAGSKRLVQSTDANAMRAWGL